MRISNRRNGRILAENAEIARTLVGSFVGLMCRKKFVTGSALVIPKCAQIHTFLMRFPLDVVFIDAERKVVGLEENIKPIRISARYPNAVEVIELPAGVISLTDVLAGDTLAFDD